MKKIILFILLGLWNFSLYAASSALVYDDSQNKIVPRGAGLQPALFPVFQFEIPQPFTDFELKATITNFDAGSTGSNAPSHDGDEVVFYYNSAAPYISNGNTGRAPYQKFSLANTYVYFTIAGGYSSYYMSFTNEDTASSTNYNNSTYAGNNKYSLTSKGGDGRRWNCQIICKYNALTSNAYSLQSYLDETVKGWNIASSHLGVARYTNIFAGTLPFVEIYGSASASTPVGKSQLKVGYYGFRNRISGVLMVCGYDTSASAPTMDKTLAQYLSPLNVKLNWSIRFMNDTDVEIAYPTSYANGENEVWYPIMPMTWISDCSNRLQSN